MPSKSFYDLDYIIELNEKRVEEYHSTFIKVLDRFTVLIIIYSAMAIFLVPLVEKIFTTNSYFSIFCICFYIFATLFLISVYFTIRLIIPIEITTLRAPKIYYKGYRLSYEKNSQQNLKSQVDEMLKDSYLKELEKLVDFFIKVSTRKYYFYMDGMRFALLSIPPYLICLCIYLWEK